MTILRPGIRAIGSKVLVLPDAAEEVTASGIVIPQEATAKEQVGKVTGTVVAIGSCAWLDQPVKDWFKPGDRVMFGKHHGLVQKGVDGREYRILSDLDFIAVEDLEYSIDVEVKKGW